MKLKIEHIPNTFNYGSLMMAISCINKIKNKFKNVEIYVDTTDKENLNRLIKETGLSSLKKIHVINEFDNLNKISKNIKRLNKEAEYYDAKIILGGDDISEYYVKKGWIIGFPLMYLSAKKIPTFLIGQSIGPFTSYRKVLAKYALNKTKIYTRDDNCLEYLEKLGIKTMTNGRDLAFLELPNKDNKKMIEKYNLIEKDYITVVASGLTKCYTENYESYINEYIKIINNIKENKKLKNKKIVLLAHVFVPEGTSNDADVINHVFNKLEDNKDIIKITEKMLASEAREILGNGLFTITGRMHAAVSTFYMRKPAISLSYSVKYVGVIGQGLDMNELVIESADNKLWENGQISKLVNEKIDFIINNYDELIEKIDRNVSNTGKIVEDQLDDLVNELKKIEAKKLENKKIY